MFCVIQTSRYICILQKCCLLKFTKLNKSILQANYQLLPRKKSVQIWNKYISVNSCFINWCQLTENYAHTCYPLIIISLPFCIVLQCYIVHASLTVTTIPTIFKQLFLLIALEINLFLYIFIRCCATVNLATGRFEKQNRQFYCLLFLSKDKSLNDKGVTHLLKQLKTDTFQQSRRFYCYSFTLWANVRITRKTYFMVSITCFVAL